MIVKYKGYEGIAYGEGSLIIRKDNRTVLHTGSWAQYPTEENIKRVIDELEGQNDKRESNQDTKNSKASR